MTPPDERMMELEIVNQYLEKLQGQVARMHESLSELSGVMESLKLLGEIKTPSQSLFPFANGIFVRGTLDSSQDVLVNVGQGVVVEKSVPQVREMLEKQRTELLSALEQANQQFDSLVARAKDLEESIEKG